jgi:hypothetical protein
VVDTFLFIFCNCNYFATKTAENGTWSLEKIAPGHFLLFYLHDNSIQPHLRRGPINNVFNVYLQNSRCFGALFVKRCGRFHGFSAKRLGQWTSQLKAQTCSCFNGPHHFDLTRDFGF